MFFSDIPGHDTIKSQLISGVVSGKVAQALLFHGPEGNASLSLSLAYAQFLNCKDRLENDSCGKCSSCVKASKFIHPDIHFTYPVIPKHSKPKPSLSTDYIEEWRDMLREDPFMSILEWLNYIKAENKQGNISVEECRFIIKNLSLKSFEGEFKVYVIWGAEYLSTAGNVLLKILEEPPENTVFILSTYNKRNILNTIISRVQQQKVSKFSDTEIEEYLVGKMGVEENEAKEISRFVDGNMFSAKQFIGNKELLRNDLFLRWMKYLIRIGKRNDKSAYIDLNSWVEEISKYGRERQKAFLKYAQFFLEESISLYSRNESRLDDSESQLAAFLLKNYDAATLMDMQRIFNDMFYYIERNANPKILFFGSSLKIKDLLTRVVEPVKK